ncbi:MAG: phosphoribosylaminoimidazolesuccinocarboxamide synthase [Candidatus Pelagibacter sp.]|jgi:phosphoribosylaminoimidazole-succinocarboxamide synthase|nr:phosphoribosylaminoimidazolesuccinocarboxamide synthase [Candidatus Pelagibacter sp.]|tara:strand:- start:7282 stop:8016 length:735 start_codon:yes stop_codon:yes gene_type:complete
MNEREKIYEGKAKILYKGTEKNTAVQYFKDHATAFNNLKKSTIEGKGIFNNRISEHIFIKLNQIGIKTHFIKTLNEREQLVHMVEIIPLEFIVRNIATGSLTKRLGITDGTVLTKPLLEYSYKNDELGDPLVAREHIDEFNWASSDELDLISNQCLKINNFMLTMFKNVGIKLVDFKLEFGRTNIDGKKEILLADEISPDTCRLWDVVSEKKLDKDRFRKDLGNLIQAYQEVAERLGIKIKKEH